MVLYSGEDELHMVLKTFTILLAVRLCGLFVTFGYIAFVPQSSCCVGSIDARHGTKTLVLLTFIIGLPCLLKIIFLLLVLVVRVVIFPANVCLVCLNCVYTQMIFLDEVRNLFERAALKDGRKQNDSVGGNAACPRLGIPSCHRDGRNNPPTRQEEMRCCQTGSGNPTSRPRSNGRCNLGIACTCAWP